MSNTRRPKQATDAELRDDTDELVDDFEDFDAFWETQTRKGPRVKVMGEVIELPPALPLAFEMEAARMERSRKATDVKRLLTLLNFPEDSLDKWLDKGMDSEQFQALLAYAPAKIAGADITLAQVVAELREEREGKGRRRS